MMKNRLTALVVVSVALVFGCEPTPPVSACTPGRSVECAGPGGCEGHQICSDEGRFDPCECDADIDGGAVDDAGADAGGDDAGGADAGDDAGPNDAGDDGGADDAGPVDAGLDGGPPRGTAAVCEACVTDHDCALGSWCVDLAAGGRACVAECVPDAPACPRGFGCVLGPADGGAPPAPVCLPVGRPCCLDEDDDTYGDGIECAGVDCDDTDADRHPGRGETCNGVDDDCDGTIDEPPTDCLESCVSGSCTGG